MGVNGNAESNVLLIQLELFLITRCFSSCTLLAGVYQCFKTLLNAIKLYAYLHSKELHLLYQKV